MKNPLKILYLEDNPNDVELIKLHLKKITTDFVVQVVQTELDFENAIRNNKPDLILSDYTLPGFDGLSAFELLKETKIEIPFILVTGEVSEEFAVSCIKAGMDDYILKSNLGRLPQSIEQVFETRESKEKIKQIESELKQSEFKFKSVLQSAQDGIILADEKGNIIFWNNYAEKLFGYSEKEALGKPITIIILNEFESLHKYGIDRFLKTVGKTVIGKATELQGLKKDGSSFPIELSLSSWSGENTKYYCGIVRDISERKLYENQLHESESSLNIAQQIAKVGSWEFDLVNQKTTWSENCFLLYGLKPFEIELTFEYFKNRVHPDDIHLIDEGFEDIIKNKAPIKQELRIIFPDGTYKWFQNNLIPYFENDKLVKLKGTSLDINERKRTEESLLKLKQAVDNTGEIVFLTDKEGVFTFVNPAFTATYGFSSDEVVGKCTPRIIKSGLMDDDYYKLFGETILRGKEATGEQINKTKDGLLLNIEFSHSATFDEKNNIIGFLAIQRNITDKKKKEVELRDSEERYRNLFELAPVGISSVNLNGKFLHCNATLERILGYSENELKNMSFNDITYPEDRAIGNEALVDLFAGKYNTTTLEKRYIRKDGQIIWVNINISMIYDDNGKQLYPLTITQDISKRKEAEQALVKSEENLRALFDNTTSGFLLMDTSFNIIAFNTRGSELTKIAFGKELQVNKNLVNKLPADRQQSFINRYKKIFRGETVSYETCYPQADKSVLWLETNSKPITNTNGLIVGISFTINDITERKLSEEKLKRSEVKFHTLYDSTKDAVMLLNENGFFDCNNSALRMFGCKSIAELCSQTPLDISVPFQKDGKESGELANQKIADTFELGINNFEWQCKRIDNGRSFYVDILLSLIELDGKQAIQATIRDITERKQAEENQKIYLKELETKNIQLTDFVNIVSHNLRAPLVNIKMLVETLEENLDEEERKEMLGHLHVVTNNINEIFDELVESLQVKQDLQIISEEINLTECLAKNLIGFKSELESNKVKIDINFDNAPIVYFPIKYMNSIFINLISNALKYKSADRILAIKIKTEKINDNIVLSFSDNGLGIDLIRHKENLFKIRKVFHKHPNARGFGLFITKTQVEAMGGKIWAESAVNVGTTFFVEFIKQNTKLEENLHSPSMAK